MTTHHIYLPFSGEELEVQAEWDYTPEDPPSMRGPGCNELLEVTEVRFGKAKLNLPSDVIEELADEIMTKMKNYEYADFT